MKAPITSPMSTITFITNALMPAYVAVERRYQNEISRYDAAPTNAQPTIRITKLFASTSSGIENTTKLRYAKKSAEPMSDSMSAREQTWIRNDTPDTTSTMNTDIGSIRMPRSTLIPALCA